MCKLDGSMIFYNLFLFKFQNTSTLIPLLDNFTCYCGFGMIEAMLESHMFKTVKATQREVGNAFFISGMFYMTFTFLIGQVCKNDTL